MWPYPGRGESGVKQICRSHTSHALTEALGREGALCKEKRQSEGSKVGRGKSRGRGRQRAQNLSHSWHIALLTDLSTQEKKSLDSWCIEEKANILMGLTEFLEGEVN